MTTPTVKSIAGSLIQTCHYIGKQYVPLPNTTLNELWNVHQNSNVISANDRHVAQYIMIGNRGHYNDTGAEGIDVRKPTPHRATDMGLYKPLPFIMRPVDDDLTDLEKAKYGMRVLKTLPGNEKYWAYYLYKLNLTNTVPEPFITTTVDGVSTQDPFVPSNSNLTPTPPAVPNDDIQAASGQYASVTALVPLELDATAIAEIVNCAVLLYGDASLAMITEIAVVSAITKSVPQLDQTGTPQPGLPYYEALRATVSGFISADFSASMNSNLFGMILDLGTDDPLFGTMQVEISGG